MGSPINSPALAATKSSFIPPFIHEVYPVSGNDDQGFPEHYDAAKDYDLFLYRGGFTFMRERSENNFHSFDWVWPDSVDYDPDEDEWFNNAEEYEGYDRTVSIRMAWADFDQQENPLTEVAISKNEGIGHSQKCSGVGPYMVPKDQLIVSVIPAAVNHWDDLRTPISLASRRIPGPDGTVGCVAPRSNIPRYSSSSLLADDPSDLILTRSGQTNRRSQGPLLPDYFMGIDPLTGKGPGRQ